MKCIKCGTDNKLKDRTGNGGQCTRCNHPFTFEPTAMGTVKFTDPFFAKAIDDVSTNGSLFFTIKQLGYILDRRLQKRRGQEIVGCFYALAFFISCFAFIVTKNFIILVSSIGLWVLLGVIMQAIQKSSTKTQQPLVKDSDVDNWLEAWARKNGEVSQQLPPVTSLGVLNSGNNVAVSDVSNYSFDRLVVCDRPAIAQMLIANNFHFEHNCAVLSVSGYPQQIFSTTMEMLRRNPDLQVFAFHDCSAKGVRLVHELGNSSDWFVGSNVRIVDIGLLPRQVLAKSKGLSIYNSSKAAQDARSLGPQIRQGLSPKELEWLDKGNYVELESFTPQKLIMVLQQGILGAQQLGSADGGDMIFVGSGSDGGFYAIDSFG